MASQPIYLNNAGTSWPKAPGGTQRVHQVLDADPRTYGALFQDARARIAARLGVSDPERLLLTPGCTSALATVIHGRRWEPGDVVVTSALEHQAVLSPIEALVRSAGVRHHVVPYRPGTPFDRDDLASVLRAGRVRAVVVTAASNVTGECLPVAEIVADARAAGAECIVDAAQTAGLIPLDVEAWGADAVAFAGHKGPLAPQGIGGLWLADGVAEAPGYCDVGSVDLPGAVALAGGLEWLASDASPSPGHAIALRDRLRSRLLERGECVVLGGEGQSTATLSVRHARIPLADAEAGFADQGIVVRAGRHCAPRALEALGVPEGTLRFSFGPFNVESDVDAVLAAIDGWPASP